MNCELNATPSDIRGLLFLSFAQQSFLCVHFTMPKYDEISPGEKPFYILLKFIGKKWCSSIYHLHFLCSKINGFWSSIHIKSEIVFVKIISVSLKNNFHDSLLLQGRTHLKNLFFFLNILFLSQQQQQRRMFFFLLLFDIVI